MFTILVNIHMRGLSGRCRSDPTARRRAAGRNRGVATPDSMPRSGPNVSRARSPRRSAAKTTLFRMRRTSSSTETPWRTARSRRRRSAPSLMSGTWRLLMTDSNIGHRATQAPASQSKDYSPLSSVSRHTRIMLVPHGRAVAGLRHRTPVAPSLGRRFSLSRPLRSALNVFPKASRLLPPLRAPKSPIDSPYGLGTPRSPIAQRVAAWPPSNDKPALH